MKRENAPSRWLVLLIASTVMMMGYVFWDILSPLAPLLRTPQSLGGMGWTAQEYGFYTGSYSLLNICLFMVFIGGVVLDRFGIIITGTAATTLMLIGAVINYYSILSIPYDITLHLPFSFFGVMPHNIKLQVMIASIGFGLFGVGCDITGITVSKIITKWFTGHELASAMGLQMAMARLGTASAVSLSPVIANIWGISTTLLVGIILLFSGLSLFILYCLIGEKKGHSAHSNMGDKHLESEPNDNAFEWKHILYILKNKGFWIIALLCLSFYGSLRPFLKFATDLLVNKFQLSPVNAGWITSILPYGTILLTPLFGYLYDRIGRGITLMFIGTSIVTACHILLAIPSLQQTWIALVVMLMLGIAFSLVPSTMWPCVPKIVPLKQLGTAYSIIYYIQNLGLLLIPIYIGRILDLNTEKSGYTNFTPAMIIFTCISAVAVLLTIALFITDKRKKYGLEKSNINKN